MDKKVFIIEDEEKIREELGSFLGRYGYEVAYSADFENIIDIALNSNSQVIALGKNASLVEKAYSVKLEDNTALLKGVVSRKKQIVPIMTENA